MITREQIIALREEADNLAMNELSCEGEYHPDFHTVSDEHFYAIAYEAGRVAEREECAKVCDKYTEFSSSPSNFAENCAKSIRARNTK